MSSRAPSALGAPTQSPWVLGLCSTVSGTNLWTSCNVMANCCAPPFEASACCTPETIVVKKTDICLRLHGAHMFSIWQSKSSPVISFQQYQGWLRFARLVSSLFAMDGHECVAKHLDNSKNSVCLDHWSSGTKCSLDLVKSFMDYGPFCVYLQVHLDEPGTKPMATTSQTHEVILRIQCPIHTWRDVRYYCCRAKMHGTNIHAFVVTFPSSNLWGTNLFRLFAAPQAEIPNVRIHVLIVELGSLGRNRFVDACSDGFPWLKTPYRFWDNDWFI